MAIISEGAGAVAALNRPRRRPAEYWLLAGHEPQQMNTVGIAVTLPDAGAG
jgi:hypothetical protein